MGRALFEDLDAELFQQFPINFRFMNETEMVPVQLAPSDFYQTEYLACQPLSKPISKIVAVPETTPEISRDR
jgi:hypothetical protein